MSDIDATIASLWLLKVDRSFVMDITEDANDRAVVKAIVSQAIQLKMMVIAKGIETDEQFAILQSIDSHEMQGDLVSPPVPAEEFYNFVSAWRAEKKYLQIIKGS